MAIPGSGTITLAQIQAEFGGSGTIGLNEYYRGGSYVPNWTSNAGIPTSGLISLNQFYNTTASITINANWGSGAPSATRTALGTGTVVIYGSSTNACRLNGVIINDGDTFAFTDGVGYSWSKIGAGGSGSWTVYSLPTYSVVGSWGF